MKTEFIGFKPSKEARSYPYIGEWVGERDDPKNPSQELVVLFSGPKTGTVIHANNTRPVGYHGVGWAEYDAFIVSNKKYQLSN